MVGDSGAYSPPFVVGSAAYTWVAMPIREEGRQVGTLAQIGRVGTPNSSQGITNLIGPGADVFLADPAGGTAVTYGITRDQFMAHQKANHIQVVYSADAAAADHTLEVKAAMAQALGGHVEKSAKGWGVGLHDYPLVRREPWMDETPLVSVPASHQDQVVLQPPGTHVLASSLFTPYAALVWSDRPAISFQFHPEFSPEFARALIETRRDRLPDPDAAIASLDLPNDNERVGGWAYQIPLYKYDTVNKRMEDLLAEPEDDASGLF